MNIIKTPDRDCKAVIGGKIVGGVAIPPHDKPAVGAEYAKAPTLAIAIFNYVSAHEGIDCVDIVSHFKLRNNITLTALHNLVEAGLICIAREGLKSEYRVRTIVRL